MNSKVEKALDSTLKEFSKIIEHDSSSFYIKLKTIFEREAAYMDKVAGMDEVFDERPAYDELREITFDLLLINFFTEDVQKLEEDYLDSEEWEDIEEETIDRGTELLNVLLYIKECEDEDMEPELGDFLREFLLVDEDEFQDEHRIYEDVIANQILVESSLDEIARVAENLSESSELKELFYPLMSFFRDQKPDAEEFEIFKKHSINPGFDAAVYSLLVSYNR